MFSKDYAIAIIGPGKVAHWHAQAIKALNGVRLVAICTRRPFQGENDFSVIYGAKHYNDADKMYRENQIDLTIICTPHPNHKEAVMKAAKFGSHILVEKPLASTLEDCDTMIEECKKQDVKLYVCSQRRWLAPVLRMKKAVDEGKIGKPAFATVNMLGWRDEAYYKSDPWRGKWDTEGGGVLVNQAPHQLDILLWIMGEIEEVYGIASNLNHPYIEVEDTATAIVKFKSGAIGNIIVSNSEKPGIYSKIQIHGKNGASIGVQTDGGAMLLPGSSAQEAPINDLWNIPGEEHLLSAFIKEDTDLFQHVDFAVYYIQLQLEEILKELDSNIPSPTLVDGEMGRRTVELFTAIYRSTQEGKPIRFPLPSERNVHQEKWVLKL